MDGDDDRKHAVDAVEGCATLFLIVGLDGNCHLPYAIVINTTATVRLNYPSFFFSSHLFFSFLQKILSV